MKLKSPQFVLILEIVAICFFHAIKLNNTKPFPTYHNIQSSLDKTQKYFERYTMALLESTSIHA